MSQLGQVLQPLALRPVTFSVLAVIEASRSPSQSDICGVLGMHALRLGSGTPSALLDWNNNYGADPNKAVCFHCSNLPKHFLEQAHMNYQQILAASRYFTPASTVQFFKNMNQVAMIRWMENGFALGAEWLYTRTYSVLVTNPLDGMQISVSCNYYF